MTCSILIPTRGRIEKLKRSIESLISNASKSGHEILMRFDFDDHETRDYVAYLCSCSDRYRAIPGPRYEGWASNNRFYQELASMARGEWCWVWNDDCLIHGPWDKVLSNVPDSAQFVQPYTYKLNQSVYHRCADNGFPLVRTKKLQSMFPLQHPIDKWLHDEIVVKEGHPVWWMDSVTVEHQRTQDETLGDRK